MLAAAILLVVAGEPPAYRATTTEDVRRVLQAAGGIENMNPTPLASASYTRDETSQYYIRMYATGGELSTFRRRENYFTEFPFSPDKPDKIQSVEQAEARMRQFMSASGIGWEDVLYFNVRRVQEVDSRNYTDYED